jgi:methionyl-tRNA formyltransferase
MATGSQLIIETVELIKNQNYQLINQIKDDLKPAPKLKKENCKIDWNQPIDTIYNQIRGLSPYPAAWTNLINDGRTIEVKIYKTEKLKEAHEFEGGKLFFTKKEIKIAVKNGYINILELKLAGKRKMDAKSLLNGYTFYENSKLV